MSLGAFQIPAPKDWQEFERLCHALWSQIWLDPNAQMHGRRGQTQNGVDVYGRPLGATRISGVQCKGKDQGYGSKATEQELRHEVEEAKKFIPPLGEFIFATTSPNDVELQRVARELTEEHAPLGLFEVHFYGWDEICQRLGKYPDTARQFFSEFFPAIGSINDVRGIEQLQLIRETHQMARALLGAIDTETVAQDTVPKSEFEREVAGQIDACRRDIESFNAARALAALQDLRDRTWDRIGTFLKWRLTSNMAAANARLGEFSRASSLYLEAYELDSSSENSHANRILANQLLGRWQEAEAASLSAFEKYPASPLLHSLAIRARSELGLAPTLEEIPAEVREDSDVLVEMGRHFARVAVYADSQRVLKAALLSKPDRIDAKILLAEVICSRLQSEEKFHPAAALSPNDVSDLMLASESLSQAIAVLRNSDAAKFAAECCFNLSSIQFVLGDSVKAEESVFLGRSLDPTDPGLVRHDAIALMQAGKAQKAIQLLEGVEEGQFADHDNLLAQALLLADEPQRARAILATVVARRGMREEDLSAGLMLADVIEGKEGGGAAPKLLEELAQRFPTDPRISLRLAEILSRRGDFEQATVAASRAIELTTGSTPRRVVALVAETLCSLNRLDDAIKLYEQMLYGEAGQDGPAFRTYLSALRGKRRYSDVLQRIARLSEETRQLPFYQRIVARVMYEAGDLEGATRNIEAYLLQHAEDVQARLLWASANIRAGREPTVRAYLQQHRVSRTASCVERADWARLMAALGMPEAALELAYDSWRSCQREPKTYIALVSIAMLAREAAIPDLDVVTNESAFSLVAPDGTVDEVLIAENEEIKLQQELPITHPVVQGALGKRVGDEVLVGTMYGRQPARIGWIKHRYAYALQVCLDRFQKLFPGHPAFFQFKYDSSQPPEDSLKPVLEQVSRRSARIAELQRTYQAQHFPLGTLARLSGSNVVEVWRGLISDRFLICAGNQIERQTAIGRIGRAMGAGAIIDLPTILAAFELNIANLLVTMFGKLTMVQSSVDVLRDMIAERGQVQGPRLTVWKEGEQFYRHEISEEEILRDKERLESVLAWVLAHCDIAAAIASTAVEIRREEFSEILDDQSIDLLIAAAGRGSLLLSDDWGYRELANTELGINGVWLQPVLQSAMQQGLISEGKYVEAIARLVDSNYEFISVTGRVLYKMAERNNFAVSDGLIRSFNKLGSSSVLVESLVPVMLEFLQLTWTKNWMLGPSVTQARSLTNAMLNEMNLAGSPHFEEIWITLVARLRLGNHGAILLAVENWRRGHFVEPPKTVE